MGEFKKLALRDRVWVFALGLGGAKMKLAVIGLGALYI